MSGSPPILQRCVRCLLPETHETLILDANGICNVCSDQDVKGGLNWSARLEELDALVEQYRGKNRYDCLVPFSGGKDSTWTLYYLMKRYPGLRPLVVRFNHGFLRPNLRNNSERVFRKLGVDVHEFTPNWRVVQRLMLQSFLEKGDFCWHCHTGIFAYPMQVAVKERVPLIFWGEPSAEYTAYYSYENPEEVNEERFNRYVNLGINVDDMAVRLDGLVDDMDLEPFRYPELGALRQIQYRSVCLGSYIPWDVKSQVEVIKADLGWQEDEVENVPPSFGYEKIECWMQGVRDYIKFVKRGYSRPSHLAAIDLRAGRMAINDALQMVGDFEGRRPPSLDIFLEYVGISEKEFHEIAISHEVSPWHFDLETLRLGAPTSDFDSWARGDGLAPDDARVQIAQFNSSCGSCNGGGSCGE